MITFEEGIERRDRINAYLVAQQALTPTRQVTISAVLRELIDKGLEAEKVQRLESKQTRTPMRK